MSTLEPLVGPAFLLATSAAFLTFCGEMFNRKEIGKWEVDVLFATWFLCLVTNLAIMESGYTFSFRNPSWAHLMNLNFAIGMLVSAFFFIIEKGRGRGAIVAFVCITITGFTLSMIEIFPA